MACRESDKAVVIKVITEIVIVAKVVGIIGRQASILIKKRVVIALIKSIKIIGDVRQRLIVDDIHNLLRLRMMEHAGQHIRHYHATRHADRGLQRAA